MDGAFSKKEDRRKCTYTCEEAGDLAAIISPMTYPIHLHATAEDGGTGTERFVVERIPQRPSALGIEPLLLAGQVHHPVDVLEHVGPLILLLEGGHALAQLLTTKSSNAIGGIGIRFNTGTFHFGTEADGAAPRAAPALAIGSSGGGGRLELVRDGTAMTS